MQNWRITMSQDTNWKVKYHPNRFLLYRKLVRCWQELRPNDGFIDVFSFVWVPFILFWFFVACPYVAFTREPIFWIYIPVMIPFYYGTFVKMNRTIDRLKKRITSEQFHNWMIKKFGSDK